MDLNGEKPVGSDELDFSWQHLRKTDHGKRLTVVDELSTYVLYDIPDDSVRTRIADVCKDYGLERIQFSAFCGSLTRNKREELYLRLGETLGRRSGKILLQPVCGKDVRDGLSIKNEDAHPDAQPDEADASGQ